MRCCGLLQIRQLTRNIHDIEVKGKFEALVVRTENLPSHAKPEDELYCCAVSDCDAREAYRTCVGEDVRISDMRQGDIGGNEPGS